MGEASADSALPKKSRGVSIVISNAIIAAIVVFLAILTTIWATVSFGTFQGGFGSWLLTSGERFKERFIISFVEFRADATHIHVRNVGTVDVDIVALYIDGESFPISFSPGFVDAPPIPRVPLKVNESIVLIVPRSIFDWKPKRADEPPYRFEVVSLRGTAVTFEWSVPPTRTVAQAVSYMPWLGSKARL